MVQRMTEKVEIAWKYCSEMAITALIRQIGAACNVKKGAWRAVTCVAILSGCSTDPEVQRADERSCWTCEWACVGCGETSGGGADAAGTMMGGGEDAGTWAFASGVVVGLCGTTVGLGTCVSSGTDKVGEACRSAGATGRDGEGSDTQERRTVKRALRYETWA